jgi:hypothetical protein
VVDVLQRHAAGEEEVAQVLNRLHSNKVAGL